MPRRERLSRAQNQELDRLRRELRGAPLRITVEIGARTTPALEDTARRAGRFLESLLVSGAPITWVVSPIVDDVYREFQAFLEASKVNGLDEAKYDAFVKLLDNRNSAGIHADHQRLLRALRRALPADLDEADEQTRTTAALTALKACGLSVRRAAVHKIVNAGDPNSVMVVQLIARHYGVSVDRVRLASKEARRHPGLAEACHA